MRFLKGPVKSYATMVGRHYLVVAIVVFLGHTAVTTLSGIVIPLNVVSLIVHLKSDAAIHYVKTIILLCIVVAMTEVILAGLKQVIYWGGRRTLIRHQMVILQSSRLPLEQSEGSGVLSSSLNEYFASWTEFSGATFSQLATLTTSMVGTVWVLFNSGIVWLGWLSVGLSVVAPVVMHKTGKTARVKIKASTHVERAEIGYLNAMWAEHRMQWLMAPLAREGWKAGEDARKLRRQTSRIVWRRLGEVQTFKLALIALGLITVLSTRETASTSVILIITTLSTNLMLMYQILDTFNNAQSKAEALTDLLDAAEKRPLLPPPPKLEVIIRRVEVVYTFTDPDGTPKTRRVRMGYEEPIILTPGINCLTAQTGGGKSTLFKLMGGSLTKFTGTILFGGEDGYELHSYEPKNRILLVEQHLKELGITLGTLFAANITAGKQILAQAAFPGANLGQSIKDFSGGERRRALTAAGLYIGSQQQCTVLCLDEPTNDLDIAHIQQLCRGLREFACQHPNMIIVIASHNPLVQKIADRRIVW